MAFSGKNYRGRFVRSSLNQSQLLYRSPVQHGRSRRRRLLIGDVTFIKHHPSNMIESSVGILEEGLFEWNPPNLFALKNFPNVLDEDLSDDDTEKPEGFALADRSSTDETAPFETETLSSALPTKLNQLETLDICLKTFLNRIKQSSETSQKQSADLLKTIGKAQRIIKQFQRYLVKEPLEDRNEKTLEFIHRLQKTCSEIVKKTRIVKKKKGTELMLDEDKYRLCRTTVRLCSLLGLRLDFLDHLEMMPPRTRNHRPLSEWIVKFLQENYESLLWSEKGFLSKELLISIGFDPTSSSVETVLARSCAGNMQQHIEPCEWAEIFVEDEFKYSVLLSQQTDKFPFPSDSVNTWFPYSCEIDSGESIHVGIMNLLTDTCETSANTACFKLLERARKLEHEQHVVLFHGTDHESDKLTADIQNLSTDFDSIEGPASIITGRTEKDELTIQPKPSSHQICLFSDDLADKFHKSLHAILFF